MSATHPGTAETSEIRFLSRLGPLLFLMSVFLLNFLQRIILAPLMPDIERDLKIGHEQAGSFFFIVSLGYCIMLLGSGFVSCRLTHKKTIVVSSIASGGAIFLVGLSPHLWSIRVVLLLLGLASGLYLASGIAAAVGLVNPKDRGKAMGVHEMAPTLAFTLSPLIAEALLGWFTWRGALMLLGTVSIATGTAFAFFGKGGEFSGDAPNVKVIREVLGKSSFWIMVILFTLGFGATLGVYYMLPLYLVSEKGMDRTWANTLLGLSRIPTPAMAIFSGWMTDRFSLRRTMKAILLSLAIVTALLGLVPTSWIVLIVFIQSMLAASFGPAGFAALSKMGSKSLTNVAVSFTIPVSFLLGGGAVPAGMGIVGEAGSFASGFVVLGGLVLSGIVFAHYLRLGGDE